MLKKYKAHLLLIFIGLLVYFSSLTFGFTHFDDTVLIQDDLFFLKNISNVFKSFTTSVFHQQYDQSSFYRPIFTVSLILDAQLLGGYPFFYHLINIVYHLIASLLVYKLLILFGHNKRLSLLFSFIFIVHPALSSTVVWIPGRNDSLLTIFLLSSFIYLKNFLEKNRLKSYFLHLLFFSLAIFTKETALFLPLLVLIYVKLYQLTTSFSQKIKLLLGWMVILLFWFFLRSIALKESTDILTLFTIPRDFSYFFALLLYLGKVFVPLNLSVLPTIKDSNLLFGVLSMFLIFFLLMTSCRKKVLLSLFGLSWFLIFLLPSLIWSYRDSSPYFLEHRLYLPIIGIFLVLLEIDLVGIFTLVNKKCLLALSCYIILLSFLTVKHSLNYKDGLSFWKNAVETSPNHPLSHLSLGMMYYNAEDFNNAEKEYLLTLKLDPQQQRLHNNLGLLYIKHQDLEKAKSEFEKEIELYPASDIANFNLGLVYLIQNDLERGEKMMLTTLKLNPDFSLAYKDLAIIYRLQNETLKANYYYQEAKKRGISDW